MNESLFFEFDTAGLETLLSQRKEIVGLHSYPLNLLHRSGDQGSHSQDPGFSLKQSRTRFGADEPQSPGLSDTLPCWVLKLPFQGREVFSKIVNEAPTQH